MTARIMIQGCGSNVGKSLIVAGLCRAFSRRGVNVAPFKPQTLSNNAAVTADGGEIGRAQALQAQAAGIPATVHLNPVLLKPEAGHGLQTVIQGRRINPSIPKDKAILLERVLDSFSRVASKTDLVIVEGAGSPAEINLRARDIANMGFARATDTRVLLIGDIERGGVIAQLLGTRAVLDAADNALIKGFLINKFHGDPDLFHEGYRFIEQRTGWRGFGVLPWFPDTWRLPAEDAADFRARNPGGTVRVVCLHLPSIANFDDLDPLCAEPDLTVEMLAQGRPIPGDTALVILPGSKATRTDLDFLRTQGWDIDLLAHRRRGGRILGLCGGYQMLGRRIADPDGIEGPPGESSGLSLLDVETVLTPEKALTQVEATHLESGARLGGYEIHIGQTAGPDCARPIFETGGAPEGATSADGLIQGTYLHGLFAENAYRRHVVESLGAVPGAGDYDAQIEATLDGLAAHLEAHLDLDALHDVARVAT